MFDQDKNCHEYCPVAKCCRYAKDSNGYDYNECGTYYKLLDLIEDARDIQREQERSMKEYEGNDID